MLPRQTCETVLLMRNTPARKDHGPRLAAYLRAQLAPGQSMRSFCLAHGLDNARVSVWESTSGDVSIDSMREFGRALDLTLGQVMVVAGYGSEDEFGGAAPPEPKPPAPDIEYAIDFDPSLSDDERRALRAVLDAVRAVKSGAAESVKIESRKARRRHS